MSADINVGPNVEAALSTSPTQAASQAEPRKTLIGAKKATPAKKGVGLHVHINNFYFSF